MSYKARKPTAARRLRHSVLTQWRGLPDGPLHDLPVVEMGTVLDKLVKSLGLTDRMRLEEVMGAWQAVAGNLIAKQAIPDSCSKGVLTIRIMQPTMHFALLQEKAQLIKKFAQHLGPNKVRDIKFRHG
jgi:predicted nucleic acid-binding Zn ribbon protein